MAKLGGLSQREVAIVITAHDKASGAINKVGGAVNSLGLAGNNASLRMFGLSHVFSEVGQSLQRLGLGLTAGGVAAFKMAADFDKSARLIQTQANLSAKGFEQMKDSMLDTAKATGRPIEELAEGMYDIFSTIDVGLPAAEKVLTKFAKASVAGLTDVRTVARSAMAMMNAFNIPAERVSQVLDAQFQLVKRGAGTYEEFANAMGLGASSADAAGQSLETYSAMIAFLTRRGLSASEAVTSTSRALDQIARPDRVKDFKSALGIDLIDQATGDYKDMVDILGELSAEFEGMARPEIREALGEVFGVGEIRAMRFFNAAIPGFQAFRREVKIATTETGSMIEAFREMRKAPFFQLDRMKESVKALGIEIGTALIPTFKGMISFAGDWIDKFSELDDSTKSLIGRVGLLVGVMSLVLGTSMKMVSNLLMMISITRLAGISFGTAALAIGKFAGGMLLVGGLVAEMSGALRGTNAEIIKTMNTIGIGVAVFFALRKGIALASSAFQTLTLQAMYAWDALKNMPRTFGSIGMMLATKGPLVIGAIALAAGIADAYRWSQDLNDALSEVEKTLTKSNKGFEKARRIMIDLTAPIQQHQEDINTLTMETGFWAQAWDNVTDTVGGAWDTFKGIMPFMVSDAEKVTQAWDGFQKKVKEVSDSLRADLMESLKVTGPAFDRISRDMLEAALKSKDFAGALEIVEGAGRVAQGMMATVGGALDKIGEKADMASDKVVAAFEKQLKATEAWARNIQKLARREVPPAMLHELFSKGPEQGAIAVQNLASLTAKELGKVIRDWRRTQRQVEEAGAAVNGFKGELDKLPNEKKVDFSAPGLNSVLAQTKAWKAMLDAIKNKSVVYTIQFRQLNQPPPPPGGGNDAAGGIVRRPTLMGGRWRGEGRYATRFGAGAEGVIPFNQRGIRILSEAMAMAMEEAGGGGGTNVYITPHKANIDAKDVREELSWAWRTKGW